MKFFFCGDLDCPDWILQEIALLSKVSAVKIKMMAAQVCDDIKADGTAIDFSKIGKYTEDAKFGSNDIKASVAALRFIVINAVRFDVGTSTLTKELQQLGLPKEHSDALCRTLNDRSDAIRSALYDASLRLPRVESVEWRLDQILDSGMLREMDDPSVQLQLHTTHALAGTLNQPKTISMEMNSEQLSLLIHELRSARQKMHRLTG